MRLVKRGKKYYIVKDDNGRQRWIATGQSERAQAEKMLVSERQKLERIRAGLTPESENPNLKVLVAIKGFLRRKSQLSKERQKALKRRLLVCCYEILGRKRIRRQVRARHIRDKIWPFLRGRRLLEMTAPMVERWIDRQFEVGVGRSGFTGSSYKTVKDKVRTINELMDFWHRRRKMLPENPLARLDMPKPSEVPASTAPRKERRAFEVDEAIEFFRAADDLDRARLERLLQEKRRPGAVRPPLQLVFLTLLTSGARTSEILTTPMHEAVLDGAPHFFIPAERCKTRWKGERRATIHPDLAALLIEYRNKFRSAAMPEDRFFLGPEGASMDTAQLLDQFYAIAYLAFVRMESRAMGIALNGGDDRFVAIYKKINFGGGSRLRPETLQWRADEEIRIRALATRLMLAVRKRLKGLDSYSLRHTHGTWAAHQEVPDIHISKQLGHRVRGITGRYISSKSAKLIDPSRSSHAVWELLMKSMRATQHDLQNALGAAAAGN